MRQLKIGELMIGRSLAYINKELMLFEAMEYLSGSPLSEAILNPEPRHFRKYELNPRVNMDLPVGFKMALFNEIKSKLDIKFVNAET